MSILYCLYVNRNFTKNDLQTLTILSYSNHVCLMPLNSLCAVSVLKAMESDERKFLNDQLQQIRERVAFIASHDNPDKKSQAFDNAFMLQYGGAVPVVPALDKRIVYDMLTKLPVKKRLRDAIERMKHGDYAFLHEVLHSMGPCSTLTEKLCPEIDMCAVDAEGNLQRCRVCIDDKTQTNNLRAMDGDKWIENGQNGMISFCENCSNAFLEPDDEDADEDADEYANKIIKMWNTVQANRDRAAHLKEPETKRARNK